MIVITTVCLKRSRRLVPKAKNDAQCLYARHMTCVSEHVQLVVSEVYYVKTEEKITHAVSRKYLRGNLSSILMHRHITCLAK